MQSLPPIKNFKRRHILRVESEDESMESVSPPVQLSRASKKKDKGKAAKRRAVDQLQVASSQVNNKGQERPVADLDVDHNEDMDTRDNEDMNVDNDEDPPEIQKEVQVTCAPTNNAATDSIGGTSKSTGDKKKSDETVFKKFTLSSKQSSFAEKNVIIDLTGNVNHISVSCYIY